MPVARALAAAAFVAGCGGSEPSAVVERSGPSWVVPAGPRRLDLLIVMEDSGSMTQEQAALAAGLPALFEALLVPDPEDPSRPTMEDLHVGVVSTDMGTQGMALATCHDSHLGHDGCLMREPGDPSRCPTDGPVFATCPAGGPPGGCAPRDIDALAADVACLASLGTSGCGWEQQLAASDRAVREQSATAGCNAGFFRPDALLAILWVTDEDDCSVLPGHPEMFDRSLGATMGSLCCRCILHPELLMPVETFLERLRRLRPDALDAIVLGQIVGAPVDPACHGADAAILGCLDHPEMAFRRTDEFSIGIEPACASTAGNAFPARRLVELLLGWVRAGGGGWLSSICLADWSDSLREFGDTIRRRNRAPCLDGEPVFDERSCTASCDAVAVLPDDGACPEDRGCPATGCPAATLADVDAGRLAPCVHPATGETCEPLHRDLGVAAGSGPFDPPRRRCLLRQASRAVDAGSSRCGAPAGSGWWYVPPAWDARTVHRCPYAGVSADAVPVGGTLEFRCASPECPFVRQCGPPDAPASICCPDRESCARDDAGVPLGCFLDR
jgi:hypothetical protein